MKLLKTFIVCLAISAICVIYVNINKTMRQITIIKEELGPIIQSTQVSLIETQRSISNITSTIQNLEKDINNLKVEVINFKGDVIKKYGITLDKVGVDSSIDRIEAYVKNTFEYIDTLKEKLKIPTTQTPKRK